VYAQAVKAMAVRPLARTAAGGVRRHFEPAVAAENPCKSTVERTGIEPVTSGLQILAGTSRRFPLVSVRR
jgi:hypothetical protein